MRIKHTPCIFPQEVQSRIIEDKMEIDIMKQQGYKIISAVGWWSDPHDGGTGECHALPIFSTDKMEDVCNRYSDYFPKECSKLLEEVRAINQTLYRSSGMSKYGKLMAFGKVPSGLQKMLDIWAGGDFLSSDQNVMRRNLIRLFNYMSKLKIGGYSGANRIAA